MSEEWFTAIPLPVSVGEAAPEHVTVFIAPTLRPDHDGATLGEFAVFAKWGALVRDGVRITLVDQDGEFEAEVDAALVDADLWSRAFEPETPVRANTVPEWQQRDWRTFAAKDASDLAKAVHFATIAADPVNPVAPLAHPLAPELLTLALQSGALQLPGRRSKVDFPVYDEGVLTRIFDDSLPRGSRGAWTTRERAGEPPQLTDAAAVREALQQLHLVRRFYERPESQAVDQVVKSPPDKVVPVTAPTPEFHERVGAAGDHPTFLRRLGLLLPVRSDAARLRRARWLAAVVRLDAPDGTCRSPRVAVKALADDGFVIVPNPADPEIWADGALALGETSLFDVIDIDPDGSAIKAERFLTTVPRYAIAQANKTPIDAASPAVRASGLTVTRRQQAGRALTQLERQEGYQAALETPKPPQDMPLLHTQDLTRGMRIEVWDSVTRVWRSLHSRRSTLLVKGEKVYSDELGDGFIQGTSATETRGVEGGAVHVHEAMFGWEGWSLSAPRPGKRVRAELMDAPGGGTRIEETVEVTPEEPRPGEKPPHPFVFTHRFADGTLPRLRFGRDYSFRAWGVDLGGNVRPHHIGPRPPRLRDAAVTASGLAPLAAPGLRQRLALAVAHDGADAEGVAARLLGAAAEQRVVGLNGEAPIVAEEPAAPDASPSAGERLLDVLDVTALRSVALAAGLGREATRILTPGRRSVTAALTASSLRALGPWGVEAARFASSATFARVTTGRVEAAARSRVEEVGESFRAAAAKRSVTRSTIVTDLDMTRDLIAGHLVDGVGATVGGAPVITPELAERALRTITPPRPFLRWDPVPPPALVPLTAYTEGESLRVVVIRSGVRQDPETLEVEITDPGAYAASVEAVAPLYAETSRRHIAPPKTSQVQAELHGVFDDGIDAGTPAARRAMLAWALRESGTFFDQSVPNLTDPNGTPSPQAGIRLLPEPIGGDHFNPSDPAKPLKVLPPGAPGTPEPLILGAGDAPAPGQYVVHDTPALGLPYLPDPLAVGASLAFTQAGAGRVVAFPWASEGITARYPGSWPDVQPFLLTLGAGTQLGAEIDGHRIDMHLPLGDVQTFRLSSTIPKDRLRWLGVWRSLNDALTGDEAVREAAADGLLWSLTPGENVTLVHAVPRPVKAPRPTRLDIFRPPGSTLATLIGGIEVHGPSTDQLSATLRWTDLIDDVTRDAPIQRSAEASGFTTSVRPQERIVPLWAIDQVPNLPGWEGVFLHSAAHVFPDTKHHVVKYRFRASTRFREFFAPALIAASPMPADPARPLDDGQSVVSAEIEISVPSTVRPDPPKVHSVLPLFRWGEAEEPEQPFGRRRTRGTGVRIYLERPWNSSGDGELLAVLLTPTGDDTKGFPPEPNPAEGFAFVSQWGSDPIWNAPGVALRPITLVELDDALSLTRFDDAREPGRPVAPAATLPLPLGAANPQGVPETASVLAVGYRPQYSEKRRMWFVDVAFDARATFWPFVRLAVARYQPDSVSGAHLSTPVRLDYVQLAPERTASVSRTDSTHARVVVSGYAGHRSSASRDFAASVAVNRRVLARLQRVDPSVGGDLGWRSVDAVELAVRGRARRLEELVWIGELEADEPMDVRTPIGGAAGDIAPEASMWRVRIEEWERFAGDPPPQVEMQEFGEAPIWEQRLVYADDIYL